MNPKFSVLIIEDETHILNFMRKILTSHDYKVLSANTGKAGLEIISSQCPDIILLDEPTNHLDMESITALNNGLIKFPGVALFSCHDHQFVQTTANRIMEILPNGALIDKMTTYDEYLASDEMARKRHVYTMTEEDN